MRTLIALFLLIVFCDAPVQAECRRVLERPDGTVIVIRPGDAPALPDESAAARCARLFDNTVTVNGWGSLPPHDLDSASIPATKANRHKWRYRNGAVIVDVSVPDLPNVAGLLAWMDANMTFTLRNNVTKAYPAFLRDLTEQKWADFKSGCIEARTAVPLTNSQWTAFKNAVIANAIPITLP